MRVLIVGASGFLGGYLFEAFRAEHWVQGTFRHCPVKGLLHLDLTDPVVVRAVLVQMRPEVVLHPAAMPDVEYCETHPQETWAVNVGGTANLADVIREIGSRLVFFSSDYVFDGQGGPYSEEVIPRPISAYGRQKAAGEERVRSAVPDCLIIRTTVVYGWERARKNFVAKLIDDLRAGRSVRVPVDQVGSPTYVRNLAQVVKELAEKGHQGIWNVVGPELMSRYAFACLAARVFHLPEERIVPVTTPELGQVAPRPLQAGLRVDKVRSVIQARLLRPEEGLQDMRAREDEEGRLG